MENYLSYLEKLQSKMDYSEGVDMKKVKEYIDIRDSCRRLSQLCVIFIASITTSMGGKVTCG